MKLEPSEVEVSVPWHVSAASVAVTGIEWLAHVVLIGMLIGGCLKVMGSI